MWLENISTFMWWSLYFVGVWIFIVVCHWTNVPSDKFEEFVVFISAALFPITAPFLCVVMILRYFYMTASSIGKLLNKRGKNVV